MTLANDSTKEQLIDKETAKKYLYFLDSKTNLGAIVLGNFSAQKVVNSEDGHYLGMSYSLVTEVFKTEYCNVTSNTQNEIPIVFKNIEEAKEKFNIDGELYFLPFDLELCREYTQNFNGDFFDYYIHENGIDKVMELFESEVPFENIVKALNDSFNKL